MISMTHWNSFKRGTAVAGPQEKEEWLGFPTLNIVIYIAVADGVRAATGPHTECESLFFEVEEMARLSEAGAPLPPPPPPPGADHLRLTDAELEKVLEASGWGMDGARNLFPRSRFPPGPSPTSTTSTRSSPSSR